MAKLLIIQTYRKTCLSKLLLFVLACSLGGNAFAFDEGKILSGLQDPLLSIDLSDDSDGPDSDFIAITSYGEVKPLPAPNRALSSLRITGLDIWNANSIRAPPPSID
jgi:hypothetical protein